MVSKQGFELKKVLISTTGLGVLLIILILVNVIFSYATIRWDATEDKIYSLSEGTRNILSNLAEPVTIKFFYSRSNRNLPTGLKLYAKRVREFLSEYEHASQGRVTVEVHDPKVDSDEEEWAQKYGMQGMQSATGEMIYCGLVFLAADQEESITRLDPSREELLEYDITRIIHRLQTPERKIIGIISTLPVFGIPQNVTSPRQPSRPRPWFFVTEMRNTYEVREIGPSTDKIDPSVDLLVIIHPKELNPKVEYAIDQYVLNGGNALIFVDPFCVSDVRSGQQQFMQPPSSAIKKLFSAWGIEMDSTKALADFDQPTRIRTGSNIAENSPVWISARGKAFSDSDVVTSRLERMLFPVAGAIKKTEGSTYEFEPMVQSGEHASLVESYKVNFGTAALRRDFVSAGKRFTIAVRVRGKFKTAFPAGPPKGDKSDSGGDEKQGEAHLETGEEKASLIIVADVDLLADRFYMRQSRLLGFNIANTFNDNLNFFSNASEILTGSDELIGLRSRGTFERPFTAVMELERQAQERWLAKEQELVRKIESTNRKLRELQQKKDASQRLIISPEQEAEIAKFKEEKQRINRELKQVRKNLRADIETLGKILKGINIFLMPFCVSIAGIAFGIYRQRRIKKR